MARIVHCVICDAEVETTKYPDGSICAKCRAEQAADIVILPDPEPKRLALDPPPAGIHVAGPEIDKLTCCALCGALLASRRSVDWLDGPLPREGIVPFTVYPEGALVERGRGWQAILLRVDAEATCRSAA